MLLIVAALTDAELAALSAAAAELGLDVLVEVHDEGELERAAAHGPEIVGVNNRDLRDFSVDVSRTERLLEMMPPGALVVSESGISSPEQLAALEETGRGRGPRRGGADARGRPRAGARRAAFLPERPLDTPRQTFRPPSNPPLIVPAMKRLFAIPFVAALLGAGVVVAVLAAAGDLGEKHTVTTVEAPTPTAAPTNASNRSVGLTPHQVYVKDAPGVAFVTSTVVQKNESPFGFGGESQREGTATGSGIVIDRNGTILTNYHVIENAVKVTVSFEKGKTVEAQVVGKDPSNDLAVLRIHPDGLTLHPIPLGNSSAVQVGDPVYAIGNPFDLQRTLTTGVVSALQRHLEAPNGFTIYNVIQTDAPINPGNSGGPLLDSQGRVIGINSQIETGGTSSGSVGIGFAVPINTAKSELGKLEKGGTVSNAGYLGVTSITIDGSLSGLNLPTTSGALVETVVPGSPAAKAGLKGGVATGTQSGSVAVGGDIIKSVDGKEISGSEDLATSVGEKKPGQVVSLKVLHPNGHGGWENKTIQVTLGKRPATAPGQSSEQQEG